MRTRRAAAIAALTLVLAAGGDRGFAAEGVRIAGHEGKWELAYGLVYYRVFGTVKNESGAPVKYVKIAIELLDKDGKPVLERTAFNQKAEALGEQETEGYVETRSFEERLAGVPPIAPGEEDLFRVGLAKDDIPKSPKFTSYRIRIMEAPR